MFPGATLACLCSFSLSISDLPSYLHAVKKADAGMVTAAHILLRVDSDFHIRI